MKHLLLLVSGILIIGGAICAEKNFQDGIIVMLFGIYICVLSILYYLDDKNVI